MPGLGDIPLLGWLFKSKSKKKTKTNLLVFLTPHIIRNDQDAAEITDQRSELLKMQSSADEFGARVKEQKPAQREIAPPETDSSVEEQKSGE